VIETTYRALHEPVEVVSLSRDVARADSTRTQVVKYHGDLRHDETLVVTESQYWKRLDFESPMDLKFRSDLLGRSVMFIGYSFRDINIRVIWFKLMQMMRDVPIADRLPSYMVRFEPNPVLEALYEAVGLRTIALDPGNEAKTSANRTNLLSEFLYTLASEASPNGLIPGSETRMFASDALIDRVESEVADSVFYRPTTPAVSMLVRRSVVDSQVPRIVAMLEGLLQSREAFLTPFIMWSLGWAPAELVARLTIRSLTAGYRRELLNRPDFPWTEIWAEHLPAGDAEYIVQFLTAEIEAHKRRRYFDEDLAYAFDLTQRLANGELLIPEDPARDAIVDQARHLVDQTVALYPDAAGYSPPSAGPPAVSGLVEAIERRDQEARRTRGEDEDSEFS
jgi:SIR2-like domain